MTELPDQTGSEPGFLERLGNALIPPDAGASESEAADESREEIAADDQSADTEELPESAGSEAEEELVEIETASGKKWKVPQELKNEFMHQSDYTRKSQDLSDLQRQATFVVQQRQQREQFDQFVAQERQEHASIKAQIAQYENIDWRNLDVNDYVRYRGALDDLTRKEKALSDSLNTKQQQFSQHLQQQQAQAARNAYEFIGRHVKGFGPDSEVERSVASYAMNHGIPPESFATIALQMPSFAVLAHKAMQFDQLQQGKTAAVQKVKAAPPVVKPGGLTSSNPADAKVKAARAQLKKSGSIDDAARFISLRMK